MGNDYCISFSGAVVPVPLQVVPQGIESVNGSDVNMGCASPPGVFGGMTICGSFSTGVGAISYLVDGISPAIDTSTSNWASRLVTVRKNDANDVIDIDHAVLTFHFDPAVSLTTIELDLFLCPELNIGAPRITLYADNNSNLFFSFRSGQAQSNFIKHDIPNKTSCDSLSTVSIPLEQGGPSYSTWHILVSIFQPDIEWVHVGEVRFLNTSDSGEPSPTDIYTSIISTRASEENTHSTPPQLHPTSVSSGITSQLQPTSVPGGTTSQLTSTSVPGGTTSQLTSTSVPSGRESDCTCSECSSSALIAVSAVSLLLIVILTTVILTQCLLMVRMRKSKDVLYRNETYAEVMTPTTMHTDVPVSPNEAYGLHKMTSSSEEATYELVK